MCDGCCTVKFLSRLETSSLANLLVGSNLPATSSIADLGSERDTLSVKVTGLSALDSLVKSGGFHVLPSGDLDHSGQELLGRASGGHVLADIRVPLRALLEHTNRVLVTTLEIVGVSHGGGNGRVGVDVQGGLLESSADHGETSGATETLSLDLTNGSGGVAALGGVEAGVAATTTGRRGAAAAVLRTGTAVSVLRAAVSSRAVGGAGAFTSAGKEMAADGVKGVGGNAGGESPNEEDKRLLHGDS